MNKFFNNIRNKILTMGSITYFSGGNVSGYEGDDALDTQMQLTYQNSLYVTRGIEVIQDAVADIDFDLYKITTSKGEYVPVEVSPIIDLLYKPNPLQTKAEFWKVLVLNYKLSGEAFVRILRDAKSFEPTGLLNLNPRDMEVELTPEGEVKYKYSTQQGIQVSLSAMDILHIKNPNPNSQLRGFGILRPLVSRIDAEIKATEYQSNLYGKNGNPDGILMVKGSPAKDILEKIKASFYNSFRGKNDQNRIAVISGGESTYTPLQTGNNSLDFIASKNNVRDEVFMALGVPKSMITSDDVNRANADAGLQQFMQFTIAPMFKMILEVFNERFVAPNYGEEYFLDTEKLVTEDKDQLLKEAQMGVNKWLTVNEVRERYGYEPLEGGDELNTANQSHFNDPSLPILQNAFKTRRKLYEKLVWKEKFVEFRSKKAFTKTVADPVFKAKFANAIDTVRSKGERLLSRESKQLFKEQKARVLAKLNEVGTNFTTANDLFDHKREKRETEKMVLPVYQNIAVSSGNVALTPVKAFFKTQNFVMNSVLYRQLEHRANLFSEGVTDSTYQKISEIVADNLDEGVPVVASKLAEMFDSFSGSRVNAIARTESCYMTSLGSQMAYQESEVVEGKEWLSTGDDRVRDEHQENDGQIVGVTEAFNNGEHFPAENSINCRCALAPVVLI